MKNARYFFISIVLPLFLVVLWIGCAYAAGNLAVEKDRMDLSGDLSISGQYGGRIFIVPDTAGAVTINWNNGNTQHITLTGNVTFTFSNGRSGTKHTLIIAQDGSGSHTVTWPSGAGGVNWSGGSEVAPTTTADAWDYFGFVYNSVNNTYDAVGIKQNFS